MGTALAAGRVELCRPLSDFKMVEAVGAFVEVSVASAASQSGGKDGESEESLKELHLAWCLSMLVMMMCLKWTELDSGVKDVSKKKLR